MIKKKNKAPYKSSILEPFSIHHHPKKKQKLRKRVNLEKWN